MNGEAFMPSPLGRLMLALVLALIAWPARSADLDYRPARAHHHHYHYSQWLPPERHVIEVVRGARGPSFIINGANFTAKTAACIGWTAGDRVRLRAGSWHGACVDATFYNATRRRTCEMWCA
jgi:hypothetical protein